MGQQLIVDTQHAPATSTAAGALGATSAGAANHAVPRRYRSRAGGATISTIGAGATGRAVAVHAVSVHAAGRGPGAPCNHGVASHGDANTTTARRAAASGYGHGDVPTANEPIHGHARYTQAPRPVPEHDDGQEQ